MGKTFLRVPAERLTAMVSRIFQAAGGSAGEAAAIARNLVDASVTGHDSHGIIRTERYVMWLRQGVLNFGRSVETVFDGPGFALLEGHNGFGQTIGPQAVAVGVAKAREHGFAVVGLRRAGHLGRIGALAEQACAARLVSIHFVNVANSVLVAPFGGAARRMSTAPVCIGVPQAGDDFILDFATSKVAEGKVLVARKEGRPAPAGSLVGPDGTLSDDPALLYGPPTPGQPENPRAGPGALVAMGEHKGSGLALACELLAGAITGNRPNGPGEGVRLGARLRASCGGADGVRRRGRGHRAQSQRHALDLHRPGPARRRPWLGARGGRLHRRHPRLSAGGRGASRPGAGRPGAGAPGRASRRGRTGRRGGLGEPAPDRRRGRGRAQGVDGLGRRLRRVS